MSESDRPPGVYEQFVEAAADLAQTASDWLRQEAETTVREKLVLPLQRLGLTIVAAMTAVTLLLMSLALIFVALLVWLGDVFGYHVVLGVSGAVLLAGAAIGFTVMARGIQR